MLAFVLAASAVGVPCTAALIHAAHGNRQERRRLAHSRVRGN